MHPQTTAVHHGVYADTAYNSVTTPIYPSSTFRFDAVGVHRGYDYTRSGNPTRAALESNLAALEGGAGATAVATGMAAVSSLMFLFRAGDHLIASDDIYGGTYRLFTQMAPRMGIEVSFVDLRDRDAVAAAIRPTTRGIWIETPSNPLLHVTDLAATAAFAKERGLLTIADNTFCSPILQRPLEFGVDLVMHSTTKYINGHSDVVGGAIVASTPELAERVHFCCNALGTTGSPFDAFLVLRGIKTLPQRMRTHCENAETLANWLASHPAVERVFYPGLSSHPEHELAARQQSGFGGMLSFELRAGADRMDAFFAGLKLFVLAESLGGVESLIEQPWTMSHASMGEAGLSASGIRPQLVRVSVGLEHPDDLKADLEAGFAAAGASAGAAATTG